MTRKAPTGPCWRLRVSRDAAVSAPRATLDVVLRKTAKGMTARVDLPDGRRIGVVAPDRRARLPGNAPLHRLCARLLEHGLFVWHVAAPGAEVPVDDAPSFPAAMASARELAHTEADLKAVEGLGFPRDVLALLRDALALGFASGTTLIVRAEASGLEARRDWMAEVYGDLPGDLAARMRLRGFSTRRRGGRKVHGWSSFPKAPTARRKRSSRASAAMPTPPRGLHRELPEGIA